MEFSWEGSGIKLFASGGISFHADVRETVRERIQPDSEKYSEISLNIAKRSSISY
jgi:hypothetical protein